MRKRAMNEYQETLISIRIVDAWIIEYIKVA